MIRRGMQVGTLLLVLAAGAQLAGAAPVPEEKGDIFDPELPNLVQRPAPVYPDSARRAGLEGIVVLRALVSESGGVDTVVVESGPAIFRAPAIAAVMQWRFDMPVLDGKATKTWIRVPIHFRLDGQTDAKQDRAAIEELRTFLLHARAVRIHRLAPPTKPGDSSRARGKPIAEFTAVESHRIRDSHTRERWVELLCDSTSFIRNVSPGYVIAWPAWALTFESQGRRVLALIRNPELTAQVRDGSRTWNGSLDARRDDLLRAIAVSFPTRARARPENSGAPAGP